MVILLHWFIRLMLIYEFWLIFVSPIALLTQKVPYNLQLVHFFCHKIYFDFCIPQYCTYHKLVHVLSPVEKNTQIIKCKVFQLLRYVLTHPSVCVQLRTTVPTINGSKECHNNNYIVYWFLYINPFKVCQNMKLYGK